MSNGEEGGGASTTTAPTPPPKASRNPTPPTPLKETKVLLRVRVGERRRGDPPRQKAQTPRPNPHRTTYEGHRRPQTHQPPQDRPRPAPPDQDRHAKVGGATAEKKDDRPDDSIVGTVTHVPSPTRARQGTVRGVHGRKGGAIWVEYPGGTSSPPPPRGGQAVPERGPVGQEKTPNPPPPQTKRLTSQTRTLPLKQLTPLTPHPDPRRRGTPLRGPMRCEGPQRDPMGHNGHAQHA